MARLREATWTELPEQVTLLVPIGSTEQHGPHLPLETDTIIAEAVAKELSGELGAWVAPALSLGASGEHAGFPGVLSIGQEVLVHVVVELVRSASSWARRTILVNGHGGNGRALESAATRLRDEGHDVHAIHCAATGADVDAHAGRTETSLLLHLTPWLVRTTRLQRGNTTPIGVLMPALRTHGIQAVSPNGILGDPRGASSAEGERLFRAMVDNARAQLLGNPLADSTVL